MTTLLTYGRYSRNLGIDVRDVLEHITDNYDDFEVDGYRFIKAKAIDEIMKFELEGDEYILGCFTPSFLHCVTGIDSDVFEAMQEAEAFEAIGKLILSGDHMDTLVNEYICHDGYGHHFAHYDGNEDEIGDYYVFRTD